MQNCSTAVDELMLQILQDARRALGDLYHALPQRSLGAVFSLPPTDVPLLDNQTADVFSRQVALYDLPPACADEHDPCRVRSDVLKSDNSMTISTDTTVRPYTPERLRLVKDRRQLVPL